MNYEIHLNTVFATPELADVFFKEIMHQLNNITFNGAAKIDMVRTYAHVLSVNVPKYRSCERASYYINTNKAAKVTLD